MIKYSIENNILIMDSKRVVFDHPVRTVVEKDSVLIVLLLKNELKEVREHYHSRNIFGVDAEGEIVWQVEAPTKDPVDLYTGLFEEDGKVIAFSWSGLDNYLDPETGKILKQEFVK